MDLHLSSQGKQLFGYLNRKIYLVLLFPSFQYESRPTLYKRILILQEVGGKKPQQLKGNFPASSFKTFFCCYLYSLQAIFLASTHQAVLVRRATWVNTTMAQLLHRRDSPHTRKAMENSTMSCPLNPCSSGALDILGWKRLIILLMKLLSSKQMGVIFNKPKTQFSLPPYLKEPKLPP